ncbi:MAG: undecaprenyl/decaprenyl-phosphate alpha-N-acetylglucosaminyl 1-phosphate transferase [Chitinophagaceae bacterium]|nr:undecaprenyl/decaprenyl-phosphate alpha-N-acetylglucosaminyl 1-phosphate transferase [Chitinophagaceae bacterium]
MMEMDFKLLFNIFGAFISGIVVHYLVIDLSLKKGIFIDDNLSDLPQKFHKVPTPRIGGLGIFIGCFFMIINANLGLYIMLAAVPAFVSGLLEDLYAKISPGRRIIIMLVSAAMAIYLLDIIVVNFGIFSVPPIIGIFITVVAIIGMINGMNLIDGINGLSAGVSLIIFTTYSILAYIMKDMDLFFVCILTASVLVSFLFFNFPKGKIFLGDGGAYFTGFILSVVSILLAERHAENISPWFVFACLIHPVFEVIFSFVRKMFFTKISPFDPDPHHIHQLIFIYLANKNNPKTTLMILPFVLGFNLLALKFYNNHSILIFISFVYMMLYTFVYLMLDKKHKELAISGKAEPLSVNL